MDTSSVEIMQTARAIREAVRAAQATRTPLETAIKTLRQRHGAFAEQYPSLFDACANPAFPLDQLRFMLEQRARLQQGQIKSVDDADGIVYERLKQKYVYPKLDEGGVAYDKAATTGDGAAGTGATGCSAGAGAGDSTGGAK